MQKLTNAEEIIMKIIWDANKPVCASYIQSTASSMGHKWKRQTISTFLLHLREKEFISMSQSGRTYLYKPIIEMNDYRKMAFDEFIRFWYDGNISELIDSIH